MSEINYINQIRDNNAGKLYDVQDSRIPAIENSKYLHTSAAGEMEWVSIDFTTDYNDLLNKPIINQDLDAVGFSPVAGTYYKHVGQTDTYTAGVIYLYDGEAFKAIDGSGSGSGLNIVEVEGDAQDLEEDYMEIELTQEQYESVMENKENTIIDLYVMVDDHGDTMRYDIYLKPTMAVTATDDRYNFIIVQGYLEEKELLGELTIDHEHYLLMLEKRSIKPWDLAPDSSTGKVLGIDNNSDLAWVNLPEGTPIVNFGGYIEMGQEEMSFESHLTLTVAEFDKGYNTDAAIAKIIFRSPNGASYTEQPIYLTKYMSAPEGVGEVDGMMNFSGSFAAGEGVLLAFELDAIKDNNACEVHFMSTVLRNDQPEPEGVPVVEFGGYVNMDDIEHIDSHLTLTQEEFMKGIDNEIAFAKIGMGEDAQHISQYLYLPMVTSDYEEGQYGLELFTITVVMGAGGVNVLTLQAMFEREQEFDIDLEITSVDTSAAGVPVVEIGGSLDGETLEPIQTLTITQTEFDKAKDNEVCFVKVNVLVDESSSTYQPLYLPKITGGATEQRSSYIFNAPVNIGSAGENNVTIFLAQTSGGDPTVSIYVAPLIDLTAEMVTITTAQMPSAQTNISIDEDTYNAITSDSKSVVIRLTDTQSDSSIDFYRAMRLVYSGMFDQTVYYSQGIRSGGDKMAERYSLTPMEDNGSYYVTFVKMSETINAADINSEVISGASSSPASAGTVLTADGSGNATWAAVPAPTLKTINNESLIGIGNIDIQGITDYNDLDNKPVINQSTEYNMVAFAVGQTITPQDKIHFNTSISAEEMADFLYGLSYGSMVPTSILAHGASTEAGVGTVFNVLAWVNNGDHTLDVEYEGNTIQVYSLNSNSWMNLDENDNFALTGMSSTYEITTQYSQLDPSWNGRIAGVASGPQYIPQGKADNFYKRDGDIYKYVNLSTPTAYALSDIIHPNDKIYFDVTKGDELGEILANMTYTGGIFSYPGQSILSGMRGGFPAEILYAADLTSDNYGYILVDYSTSISTVIYATQAGEIDGVPYVQGFQNLAIDNSRTVNLSGDATLNNVYETTPTWNGTIIGKTPAEYKYKKVSVEGDISHVLASSATSTTNATSTTTDPYLNIVDNGAVSGSIKIQGSGATTVNASNGTVTISSLDSTYYSDEAVDGIYIGNGYSSHNVKLYSAYERPLIDQVFKIETGVQPATKTQIGLSSWTAKREGNIVIVTGSAELTISGIGTMIGLNNIFATITEEEFQFNDDNINSGYFPTDRDNDTRYPVGTFYSISGAEQGMVFATPKDDGTNKTTELSLVLLKNSYAQDSDFYFTATWSVK